MASIIISGDTSGSATLQAQAIAGNTTLTLPTTSGTVLTTTGGVTPGTSGNVLTSNGTTWISSSPSMFMLAADGNATATRNVFLTVGTWQVVLQDAGGYQDGSNHNFTVTRNGTISTTTVTTSWTLIRGGGAGYGRFVYGTDNAVGTLVVASDATVTMSIAAPVVTGSGAPSAYSGAILWANRIS
jgi:hypothetical protein